MRISNFVPISLLFAKDCKKLNDTFYQFADIFIIVNKTPYVIVSVCHTTTSHIILSSSHRFKQSSLFDFFYPLELLLNIFIRLSNE